ncbi:hypothetical protein EPO15_16260 [bacterium]|nr:MAG: hypothetical protein EPO15_16260 [bacterium]
MHALSVALCAAALSAPASAQPIRAAPSLTPRFFTTALPSPHLTAPGTKLPVLGPAPLPVAARAQPVVAPAPLQASPLAASPAGTALNAAASAKAAPEAPDVGAVFDGRGFLADLETDAPALENPGKFVVPNERHPADMRPILERAPAGAYVTVGTERGFIAAALAPAITHLVLADIDPHVVAYNRTNIALLRLSRSRAEYAALREQAPQRRWVELARERGMRDLIPLLSDPGNFKAWRKYQTRNLSASRWTLLKEDVRGFLHRRLPWLAAAGTPGEEHRPFEFAGANYLRDDALYGKVKAMADQGRIKPLAMDLGDAASVSALTSALGRSGVALGALDLSNVWESVYLKARPVMRLVQSFLHIAAEDSLLVISQGGGSVVGYTGPAPWEYFGFRMRDLAVDSERGLREVFAYSVKGYAPNALNTPAVPDGRPRKPEYNHDRYKSYWWEDSRIEAR